MLILQHAKRIYNKKTEECSLYKILEDGSYFGAIPGLKGVWASANDLERCREELRDVLEDWLFLKVRKKIKNSSEELIHQLVPEVFFDEVSFALAFAHNGRFESGFVSQDEHSQTLRRFRHRARSDFSKFRYFIKFNFVHAILHFVIQGYFKSLTKT